MNTAFACLVLILALVQPVRAASIADAEARIAIGDAAGAIRLLEPIASAGDAAAGYLIGTLLLDGVGVLQDHARAAVWLEKSARLGNARAQNLLGRLYAEGLGVEADAATAVSWMTLAAEKGAKEHQYDIAMLLADPRHGVTDGAAAVRWFQEAAEQGHPAALTGLGLAYQAGEGVEKNLDRASEFFERAAAAGDARGQNNLGLMLARGEGVAQDHQRAAELFAKAAEKGQIQAFYNLGVMYENGFGVPLDESKARDLYAAAGRAGGLIGKQSVAVLAPIYDARLKPLPADGSDATDVAAAARHGDPVAMFLTAYALASKSDAASLRDASDWFRKAADRGLPAAMANLGLLHLRGAGVPQDFVLGYAWLAKAAAAGLTEAAGPRDAVAAQLTPGQRDEAAQMIDTLSERTPSAR